jgi:hypothetical protein
VTSTTNTNFAWSCDYLKLVALYDKADNRMNACHKLIIVRKHIKAPYFPRYKKEALDPDFTSMIQNAKYCYSSKRFPMFVVSEQFGILQHEPDRIRTKRHLNVNLKGAEFMPRTHQWRSQEFCTGRGVNKFSWGQRAERRGRQGFRSICKWVKPVFLLGFYRCIFHETGNSPQLCQNFGISRVLTLQPPLPPSRYTTGIHQSMASCPRAGTYNGGFVVLPSPSTLYSREDSVGSD